MLILRHASFSAVRLILTAYHAAYSFGGFRMNFPWLVIRCEKTSFSYFARKRI